MRKDRANNEMRPIKIQTNFTKYAEGSTLISFGNTIVLCNATVEERVPPFVKEKGLNHGWITAEYNMLPRSTHTRSGRERFKVSGRTQEIQRLIGRSLRSVVDLASLGPRTITIDCDVIQADGGTRTTAISGAYISLMLALRGLKARELISDIPVCGQVAAVSVGKCNDEYYLDLDYNEDSQAQVDMNVVMTDKGDFIEIQGSGEENPFSVTDLDRLVATAKQGIEKILQVQKESLV